MADVPRFTLRDHDAARRFITLVDELYEHRCYLVLVGREGPDALFPSENAFERERTAEALPGVDRAGGPALHPGDPAHAEADDHAALELASVRELAFAFRRCSSRLAEMASPDWPACGRAAARNLTVAASNQSSQKALSLEGPFLDFVTSLFHKTRLLAVCLTLSLTVTASVLF